MLEVKVLISELVSVDGFSSSSVSKSEVSSLSHELRDDSVEGGVFVVEGLSRLSYTLLSGTESSEILSSLRNDITEESKGDSLGFLSVNGDIKEDFVGNGGGGNISSTEGEGGNREKK